MKSVLSLAIVLLTCLSIHAQHKLSGIVKSETGEEMLGHMTSRLAEAGIEFYFSRVKFKVEDALKRSGLYNKIGAEHFFVRRTRAIKAIKEKYGDSVDVSHLIYHKPVEIVVYEGDGNTSKNNNINEKNDDESDQPKDESESQDKT